MASSSTSAKRSGREKQPASNTGPFTGTARKVDPNGLRALIQEHERALQNSLQNITKQEEYQLEYQALTTTLRNLPNKLRHEALVPLGPLVMAKGKLIHTNEITCHLGDNWFVECSAKTAEKLAFHRIQKSKEMLNKYEKEKELITSWISEARRQLIENETEGTVEITEIYDDEQEKQWRKEHREKVKKYYQQAAKERENPENFKSSDTKEDEELWERLDMLELEEELSEYENRKKSKTDVVQVPSLEVHTSNSTVPEKSILKLTGDGDKMKPVEKSPSTPEKLDLQKRRVSFDASKDIIHSYPADTKTTTITSPVVECELKEDIVQDAFKHHVIEKTYTPKKFRVPAKSSVNEEEEDEENPPQERMSLFKQRRMMEESQKNS